MANPKTQRHHVLPTRGMGRSVSAPPTKPLLERLASPQQQTSGPIMTAGSCWFSMSLDRGPRFDVVHLRIQIQRLVPSTDHAADAGQHDPYRSDQDAH